MGHLSHTLADLRVTDAFSEVGHVLKPHVRRDRIDDDEVQFVDLDGVLSIDAGVAGSERDLAGSGIDQPLMVEVVLISQRGGDLLKVDAVQSKHPVRLDPAPGIVKERDRRGSSGPLAATVRPA